MADAMRFTEQLVAPAPGMAMQFGSYTVMQRDSPERSASTPRFFVYDAAGELVSLAKSWRLLCHSRRWQLDPVEAFRRPQSWPEAEMTDWEITGWQAARNSLLKDPDCQPDPIPSAHAWGDVGPFDEPPEPFRCPPSLSHSSPSTSAKAAGGPAIGSPPSSASTSTASPGPSTADTMTPKAASGGSPRASSSSSRASTPSASPALPAAPSVGRQENLF